MSQCYSTCLILVGRKISISYGEKSYYPVCWSLTVCWTQRNWARSPIGSHKDASSSWIIFLVSLFYFFFKLKVYPVLVPSLDVWVLLMLRNYELVFSTLQTQWLPLSFASAATVEESVSFPHSLLDTFTHKVNPSVVLHAILLCLPVRLPAPPQRC